MSIDKLQERIRKLKNPSVIDLSMTQEQIPQAIFDQEGYFPPAYERACKLLLDALKDIVPAVRFSLNHAVVYGPDGLVALSELLRYARELGYYVILDAPAALGVQDASHCAQMLLGDSTTLKFNALAISSYIGADGIRPYADMLSGKDCGLFVAIRTSNRSAQDLQDLLTGSRLVHQAAADLVNRFCQNYTGSSGYAAVAGIAAANAAESIRFLRTKYKYMFLMVDGYDAVNANAKNCANAFDSLGHGAVVCAGSSVTAAWQNDQWTQDDYAEAAVEAVRRMKKNLCRYVTIL